MAMPSKIAERLANGLRRFQPILSSAKARDVNESDTSMIVTDVIAELFGYDKYNEITRELCIRGTYCDLATKVDGKFQLLIEVKAIGLDLKDTHVKQVVDYAANQGIEWVAVTNGPVWRVYRVSFGKPIEHEMVLDINLLELNHRNQAHIDSLYLLTRESIVKSALNAYHDQRQATSRFFLAAVLLTDPILEILRRELRRLSPDLKVQLEELREAVREEVLKRDVIEGEKADQARKKVNRSSGKALRKSAEKSVASPSTGSDESASDAESDSSDRQTSKDPR